MGSGKTAGSNCLGFVIEDSEHHSALRAESAALGRRLPAGPESRMKTRELATVGICHPPDLSIISEFTRNVALVENETAVI
jgi:hypothetical protein